MTRRDQQRRSGSAMAGAGAVTTGTGLLAGGIPGAKEPDTLRVWLLRGHSPSGKLSPKEVLRPANLANNARQIAPQPRAGILGFRANMHNAYIEDEKNKPKPGNSYVKGMRAGKLSAEHEIVRGMRMGRRAAYPLTFGGAALTVAGLHRRNKAKFGKSDRKHGAVAGTGGALGGGTLGAYLGLRGGAEAGVALANRKIKREHVPGTPFSNGDRMVQRINGMSRGIKAGTVIGTSTLGYTGYRLARGSKVQKAESNRQDASSAAVGAGLATTGVGHFVPKGLKRYEQRYVRQAQEHTLAAQKLAPHFGGLQTKPAKIGAFGEVRRPERTTMYPEVSDNELRATNAHRHIKGGAQVRTEVGRHRGVASQARHFAEVFDSTGRAIRRARGPGLALTGAGMTGLWASQGRKGSKQSVSKAQYGYMDKERSLPKTVEMLAGLGLLAHGGSRLKMLGPAAAKGVKLADERGAGKEARAALELARVLGEKTRDVTGRGETQLRRIKTLDNAISSVPAYIRPEVATAAGVLLSSHAHPTTRERFTPLGGS